MTNDETPTTRPDLTDGIHWLGPIGLVDGSEQVNDATLVAYREMVDDAAASHLEDVRKFVHKLPRYALEQMFLTVINETAVQLVRFGYAR